MRFRPCIDIHNGKVKQIVGGGLAEQAGVSVAKENFVSEQDGGFFGALYREKGLAGGHIILLNPAGTEAYTADLAQAKLALKAFPGGFQIGGGVNGENAASLLALGATHVIVTSWLFDGGKLSQKRLEALVSAIGREHLVLDFSCRRKGEAFYVVTDRWQTYTDLTVTPELLLAFEDACDEYLIHGVDREGTGAGMDEELLEVLREYRSRGGRNPVTYAGGIGSIEDLRRFRRLTEGMVDVTIGSALDLFGGEVALEDVMRETM